MTPDVAFQLANLAVLPAWAMLIFVPRWSPGRAVIASIVTPLVLTIGYVAGLSLTEIDFASDFNSLSGIESLFANRWALVAGWIHYLVFDLFVGRGRHASQSVMRSDVGS